MSEVYIAQECITLCLRYFEGVETIFNHPQRNNDSNPNTKMYLFDTSGWPKG